MMTTRRVSVAAACFGFVLLLAVPAGATISRINSMGGGVKNLTIEDEANIFQLPSLLVRYGNMTYIDNLDAGLVNTIFGFHYSITEDLVLAVYGGRINGATRPIVGGAYNNGWDAAGNTFTGTNGINIGAHASEAGNVGGAGPNTLVQNGGDTIDNVDLKIGLLFAARLGSTIRLGVMLNFSGDDGDTEQPTQPTPGFAEVQTDVGAMLIDAAVGLGIDLVGHEIEFSLGLEYGTLEDFRDGVFANNPTQQGDLIEHWSASHLGLRVVGRWTADLFDTHKLVTYLRFHYGSQEVTHNNSVSPITSGVPTPGGAWDAIDLTLGTDLRLELFDNVIVAPGLGLRYAQQNLSGGGFTDRDVDRLTTFPFYGVGVDLNVFDWLDFRFGAAQYVNFYRRSSTSQAGTIENRESDVETVVKTGLGFLFPIASDANPNDPSMLKIDIDVNPMFWINGPDFITGNATNTPFEGSAGRWGLSGAISYDW